LFFCRGHKGDPSDALPNGVVLYPGKPTVENVEIWWGTYLQQVAKRAQKKATGTTFFAPTSKKKK
jgi:hypothetical protein